MRLSSLARKIRITPKQLSSFLEKKQVILEKGANTKLDEKTIDLVLKHFKVSLEELKEVALEPTYLTPEIAIKESVTVATKLVDQKENINVSHALVEENNTSDHTVDNDSISVKKNLTIDNEEANGNSEEQISTVLSDEFEETTLKEEESVVIDKVIEQPTVTGNKEYEPIETFDGTLIEARAELAALDDSVDIIKAPKPAPLQGLTIKGKIELPNPKPPKAKKESPEKPLDPNKIIYTNGPIRERYKKSHKKKNGRRPKEVNTIEQERKKKAYLLQKEKEKKERVEKETKTAYYEKNVKTYPKQKAVKKKAKKKNNPQKETKFEGNTLQRFWVWLNT